MLLWLNLKCSVIIIKTKIEILMSYSIIIYQKDCAFLYELGNSKHF